MVVFEHNFPGSVDVSLAGIQTVLFQNNMIFCNCATIVADSAIELDEICLNYSKSFHSLNAQIP